MPTKLERQLVDELIYLTHGINEQGKYDADVELGARSVHFRITKLPYAGEWSFYGEDPAYFQRSPWTEADFAERIGVFIRAAKQHHDGYDDDGEAK